MIRKTIILILAVIVFNGCGLFNNKNDLTISPCACDPIEEVEIDIIGANHESEPCPKMIFLTHGEITNG